MYLHFFFFIKWYILNKTYIQNITTLFMLKCLYCCNPWYLSKVWWEHPYFFTNAISKTQLNVYKKKTINSAQIVFTLQNTNMQTLYYLLVFKFYFNCCKVEGHHLHHKLRMTQLPSKLSSWFMLYFLSNTHVLTQWVFSPVKRCGVDFKEVGERRYSIITACVWMDSELFPAFLQDCSTNVLCGFWGFYFIELFINHSRVGLKGNGITQNRQDQL